MTLAGGVVQTAAITPSRSYRTRDRRSPFSQPIVRATTQRTFPGPLLRSVRLMAMCGSLPSHRALRVGGLLGRQGVGDGLEELLGHVDVGQGGSLQAGGWLPMHGAKLISQSFINTC
jgi:hypothetical protein